MKRFLELINEQGGEVPDPSTVAGTLEDPIIDPTFDREVFFKRFTVKNGGKNREIILKRVGFGPNAPSISYIDGIRYEIFTTPQQAERETLRALKDGSFDETQKKKKEKSAADAQAGGDAGKEGGDKEKKPPQPPPAMPKEELYSKPRKVKECVETLASVVKDRSPKILSFSNGDERLIPLEEAINALEMMKLLDIDNRQKFMDILTRSEKEYCEMMDFLLDRIRKGVI